MRSRSPYFLSVLLLSSALGACGSEPSVTNSVPEVIALSNRIDRIDVEQAFRRALGSIKGRVNLLNQTTHYRVARATPDAWHVQLKGARDVPGGDLLIAVKDSGSIELRLTQTNVDAAVWLASAKASEPDPDVRVRPEAAFRQGLQALEKWYKTTPESYFAVRGRILLRRTARDEWFMDVAGSGTPLGGWWIQIKDNGTVNVEAGL